MPRSRHRPNRPPKGERSALVHREKLGLGRPASPRGNIAAENLAAMRELGFPVDDIGKDGCCTTCGTPLADSSVAAGRIAIGPSPDGKCAPCRVARARSVGAARYLDTLIYGRRGTFKREKWAPVSAGAALAKWELRIADLRKRLTVIESVLLYPMAETVATGSLVEAFDESTDFGPVHIMTTLAEHEVYRTSAAPERWKAEGEKGAWAALQAHLAAEHWHYWHHVSVSLPDRLPTHDEMAYVKDQFIGQEREAYSVWAPLSRHVNDHKYCLHLWHSCSLSAGPKGEVLPNFSNPVNGRLSI